MFVDLLLFLRSKKGYEALKIQDPYFRNWLLDPVKKICVHQIAKNVQNAVYEKLYLLIS